MTDAADRDECGAELRQQAAVTMTTDEKYAVANELLQQVDGNIVKTATLRKQMPAKCVQLLARRCRFQLSSAVSVSCCHSSSSVSAMMTLTCIAFHLSVCLSVCSC